MKLQSLFKNHKYKLLYSLISIIVIIILGLLYWHISSSNIFNSDNSAPVLEAHSILKGNIQLKGWNLSSDNFYTIDLPFYIIVESIVGIKSYIPALVPTIIYLLTIIASLYLSTINLFNKEKIYSLIISFGLIATAPIFYLNQTLVGPDHVGTILFILISFILIFKILKKGRYNYYLIPFFIISFMYLFGDPLSRYIGIIPIILFSIFFYFYEERKNKVSYILIGGSAILSLILSLILRGYTLQLGFFNLIKISNTFVNLSQLNTHIYYFFYSLLKIQGAYFFGETIFSKNTLLDLLRFLILILILFSIYLFCKKSFKSPININKIDKLNFLLITSFILNILAFIFANITVNVYTSRYLMFLPILGGLLLARYLSPYIAKHKIYPIITVLIVFFLFFVLIDKSSHIHKPMNIPQEKISVFLKKHNLKYGYGSYWNSATITLYSENKVKVRQVLSYNNKLYPYLWLSNYNWYTRKADFVIFGNQKTKIITKEIAINSFGKPYKEYKIDGYTILAWNYNISKKYNL